MAYLTFALSPLSVPLFPDHTGLSVHSWEVAYSPGGDSDVCYKRSTTFRKQAGDSALVFFEKNVILQFTSLILLRLLSLLWILEFASIHQVFGRQSGGKIQNQNLRDRLFQAYENVIHTEYEKGIPTKLLINNFKLFALHKEVERSLNFENFGQSHITPFLRIRVNYL